MCLGLPGKVIDTVEGFLATVDIGGNQREVSIMLLEDVSVGDYVLVHAGFAVSVLDEDLAKEMYENMIKLAEMEHDRDR